MADTRPGVEAAKRRLLRLCAASNRGLGALPEERDRILKLVEQLEDAYQAPADVAERSRQLEGSWAIIFTTSADLTPLDRLPFPGWRTGRIGQAFMPGGEATNEIDFLSPFGSRVCQTVRCEWGVQSPAEETFRTRLTFVGSSTKLSEVAGFGVPVPPLAFPLPPAAGFFRVSYLDDEILVQRTRAGAAGVNVLVREDDDDRRSGR